jgi:hypothetical protein
VSQLKAIIVAISIFVLPMNAVYAETQLLFKCSHIEGKAAYLGEKTFVDDKVNGGIEIHVKVEGDLDARILVQDIAGRHDVVDDGGKVLVLNIEPVLIVVVYPGVIETYQLNYTKEVAQLIWTSNRGTGLLRKGSLMTGGCTVSEQHR